MRSIIAAILILGAAPALARAHDADGKTEKVPKAKKVCRSHRETGSNMAVTTCRPQAEWDQIDADHSVGDAVRDIRNQGPH